MQASPQFRAEWTKDEAEQVARALETVFAHRPDMTWLDAVAAAQQALPQNRRGQRPPLEWEGRLGTAANVGVLRHYARARRMASTRKHAKHTQTPNSAGRR